MSLKDCIKYSIPDQTCCEDFGCSATLRRYPNFERQPCTSGDRGCAVEVPIWIEIQPSSSQRNGEMLIMDKDGDRAEAEYSFYFNPYHPKNLEANGGNPIFMVTGDSTFISDGFDSSQIKHADIIEYMGQLLMVCNLRNWDGETCVNSDCGLIDHQNGFLLSWVDDNNERNATIENDEFDFEGEINE